MPATNASFTVPPTALPARFSSVSGTDRYSKRTAVERSVSNEFFSHGLTQGIAVGRVTDRVAWEVSLNDGSHIPGNPEPANTPFNSTLEADWSASWRLDWKFAGDWARFADFASWRGSDEGLKIGGGLHFQTQGGTTPREITSDFFFGTAQEINALSWAFDVQYEGDGWSLFGAYHGHRLEWEFTPNRLTVSQHGWVIQGWRRLQARPDPSRRRRP